MGVKRFIKSVIATLGLKDFEQDGKKRAIKDLLKKLRSRKKRINAQLKASSDEKEKIELKEQFEIISLQIKKGKKILYKLYSKR